MRKIHLIVTLLFFVSGVIRLHAQGADAVREVRNELFYTDFNFDKCLEYYNRIVKLNVKTPLIQAYQAAAQSLMAKHSWNPVSKFTYLKDAQELLNKAVMEDKDNPEIRFLRLYIQRSIPSYMGMSKDIAEDKQAILDNLDKLDIQELGQDIADYIARYMASPDITSGAEASLIRERLQTSN